MTQDTKLTNHLDATLVELRLLLGHLAELRGADGRAVWSGRRRKA
jgi:hypothetical protein